MLKLHHLYSYTSIFLKITGVITAPSAPDMVVLDMLKWRCPPVLILFVLLIRWNPQIKHSIEPRIWFSTIWFLFAVKSSDLFEMFLVFCPKKFIYSFVYFYLRLT